MKRCLLILFLAIGFVNIKAQTVDTKIAVNNQIDDKTFVVIVSNENYKNEESVPFANNDGEVFKVYCQKTLGIPENHIRFSPLPFLIVRAATLSQQPLQLIVIHLTGLHRSYLIISSRQRSSALPQKP